MPSQKSVSSQSPATQANRTPIAFVSQAPRKHTPAATASNSATLLKELEQLETLPAFTSLPPDHPLRARLTPFFTAIRKLISGDPTLATDISHKLEKIESLISHIDKKIQPPSQATYTQIARTGIASPSPTFAPLSA